MRKLLHWIDDKCRSIAAGIIVAPMLPFDDGKVKIPTAQAALWIIMLIFLPVTLLLSTPFWAAAYGAHKLAKMVGES